MHDPMTMVFRIRLPRLRPKKGWSWRSRWLWTVATVWHRDPSGFDSTTCKFTEHWKHPNHWRIQADVWQDFRHRWLDRCAWCGKGATKKDPVNISYQWNKPKRPWWRHTDCFHMECSSIYEAHKSCVCRDGLYVDQLAGWGYGGCILCGKRREWRPEDRRDAPTDEARRLLASIPKGQRDADKYAEVQELWSEYRKAKKDPEAG